MLATLRTPITPFTRCRVALLNVAVIILAACGDTNATMPPSGMSTVAYQHVDYLIGVMQANSIKRRTINWNAFRDSVLRTAAGAQTIAETYPAIRTALTLLGDGHSQYIPVVGSTIFVPTHTCSTPVKTPPALPPNIGYIKVGSFNQGGAAALAFADGIQNAIRVADRDDLVGWIVDLRGNGGGNMWPMIAGLGPIIGESGVIGYFIDPFGVAEAWEYHDGASWLRGKIIQSVSTAYHLKRQQPKVAVLQNTTISSSGEATLIAFRQRPDTRSFGSSSCGFSTANLSFPMADGGTLILTVSTMADRNKTMFGDRVVPDEEIADTAQVVPRAVQWLSQP